MLQLLDALGKWSLVDAYVLVLMMVAFRFHLGSEALHADVLVGPHWGFFGFIGAAVTSLTLSHIILYYHRYVEGTTSAHLPDGGPKVRCPPLVIPQQHLLFLLLWLDPRSIVALMSTAHLPSFAPSLPAASDWRRPPAAHHRVCPGVG